MDKTVSLESTVNIFFIPKYLSYIDYLIIIEKLNFEQTLTVFLRNIEIYGSKILNIFTIKYCIERNLCVLLNNIYDNR